MYRAGSAVTSPILTRMMRQLEHVRPESRTGRSTGQALGADHVALLLVMAVWTSGRAFGYEATGLTAADVAPLAGCSTDTARRKLGYLATLGWVDKAKTGRVTRFYLNAK